MLHLEQGLSVFVALAISDMILATGSLDWLDTEPSNTGETIL